MDLALSLSDSIIDQLKHLLIAIGCCLAVAGSAQTPYNPDSNSDGMVGSEDLVTLLSFYGNLIDLDSLTVASVNELPLLGSYSNNGWTAPRYLVPNEVDVVLFDPDSCFEYLLQMETGGNRSILYEADYAEFPCWLLNDSMIVAGCTGWSETTFLTQAIRLGEKVFCIE